MTKEINTILLSESLFNWPYVPVYPPVNHLPVAHLSC